MLYFVCMVFNLWSCVIVFLVLEVGSFYVVLKGIIGFMR